ncbi:hypothetical protein PO909_029297 [Leuciscus waleckii]
MRLPAGVEGRRVAAGAQVHGEWQAMSNPGGAGRLRVPGDVTSPMVNSGAEGERSGGGGVSAEVEWWGQRPEVEPGNPGKIQPGREWLIGFPRLIDQLPRQVFPSSSLHLGCDVEVVAGRHPSLLRPRAPLNARLSGAPETGCSQEMVVGPLLSQLLAQGRQHPNLVKERSDTSISEPPEVSDDSVRCSQASPLSSPSVARPLAEQAPMERWSFPGLLCQDAANDRAPTPGRYASHVRAGHSASLLHRGYVCDSHDAAGTVLGSLARASQPVPLGHENHQAQLHDSVRAVSRFRGVCYTLVGGNAPIMRAEVATLLAKGAIETVPSAEMKSGFYSP